VFSNIFYGTTGTTLKIFLWKKYGLMVPDDSLMIPQIGQVRSGIGGSASQLMVMRYGQQSKETTDYPLVNSHITMERSTIL
jgi:hypothetical protein